MTTELKVIEIIYNTCYGRLTISDATLQRYKEITGNELPSYDNYYYPPCREPDSHCIDEEEREDPALVQAVKELGEKANGKHSRLRITTVVSGYYSISEDDGIEKVAFTPRYTINDIRVILDDAEIEDKLDAIRRIFTEKMIQPENYI